MSENLFDLAAEYDQMLEEGLSLSGENRAYFARGRIALLRKLMAGVAVRRILDFGCGTGDASVLLNAAFACDVVGIDNAPRAIEHARAQNGSQRISFQLLDDFRGDASFDLCYVNGVFHHIPVAQRLTALRTIHNALRKDGRFAFFENNPWNPGTRMVMSRIRFDADAITITLPEARRLLAANGFALQQRRTLFYFPRSLHWMRFLEGPLSHLPLGAQYLLLSQSMPTACGIA